MRRILEGFFMILIFFSLMKAADTAMCFFVEEIAVQNILSVLLAFIILIISAALAEWIVKMIKKHL